MPFLAEYSKMFEDNQCLYAVHIFCMISICVVHGRREYICITKIVMPDLTSIE